MIIRVYKCGVFVLLKVIKKNKNFTDIMGQYKNQPQAASHVYRSVLLRRVASPGAAGGATANAGDPAKASYPPPTPNR